MTTNTTADTISLEQEYLVGTYARENGYTAIFILKPNDLVFLTPGADITDTVIKLYNQKYPFPGAAAGK